ncbi:hypothetical protein L596_024987 [Steinernema carpocapsae]|uniref:DOMON domain-containing protein n=1 Tax=Steinernema carpocapsae TaxID=34508 RepID=A0A4U5M6G6_STECR|nr:hypothetical protein L596_024987 [Steinernema carpocapsae]
MDPDRFKLWLPLLFLLIPINARIERYNTKMHISTNTTLCYVALDAYIAEARSNHFELNGCAKRAVYLCYETRSKDLTLGMPNNPCSEGQGVISFSHNGSHWIIGTNRFVAEGKPTNLTLKDDRTSFTGSLDAKLGKPNDDAVFFFQGSKESIKGPNAALREGVDESVMFLVASFRQNDHDPSCEPTFTFSNVLSEAEVVKRTVAQEAMDIKANALLEDQLRKFEKEHHGHQGYAPEDGPTPKSYSHLAFVLMIPFIVIYVI